MYYATANNYEQFRQRFLNNATVNQIANELIVEAYENAESLINSYLCHTYSVPFPDYPDTPEVIQTIHNQLALYYLLIERGVGFVKINHRSVEIGYENSIALLEKLSAGGYKGENGKWVKVGIPGYSRVRKFGVITGTDGLYEDRDRGFIFGLNPNTAGFATDSEIEAEPLVE